MKEREFSMGKAIRKACIDANCTQNDLAKRLGMSPVSISRMMQYEHVTTKRMIEIGEALDIEPATLFEMAYIR